MGLFDFFKQKQHSANNKLFTKAELVDLISYCDSIGKAFAQSPSLIASGNGRAQKMSDTMVSYKCILVHFYSAEYKYGSSDEFIPQSSASYTRYVLTSNVVLANPASKINCLKELRNNWQDIIKVVNALRIEGDQTTVSEIERYMAPLTRAFELLSNHK